MRYIKLQSVWERRKRDRVWCTDAGDIFPEDMVTGVAVRHPDYQKHMKSVQYWRAQLIPYRGRVREMPDEWAMMVDDSGMIIDGYHRMAGAVLAGVGGLPYVVGDWEGWDF